MQAILSVNTGHLRKAVPDHFHTNLKVLVEVADKPPVIHNGITHRYVIGVDQELHLVDQFYLQILEPKNWPMPKEDGPAIEQYKPDPPPLHGEAPWY